MDEQIIPKTSQLVHIVAAATSTLVYTIGTGRTAQIKKIMLMNNTANVDHVILGELVGGVWTPRLPAVYVLAGFDERVFEFELPVFEFTSNIYAQGDSAGLAALTPEDIIVEVSVTG